MFDDTVDKALLTDYHTLAATAPVRLAELLFERNTFLVIEDACRFIGLLTPKDLVYAKKMLVGDCLVKKPKIDLCTPVEEAMKVLLESGYHALPCYDTTDTFCGVVTVERVLEYTYEALFNASAPIVVKNIIGEKCIEKTKALILGEISHQTKNQIQVILSAMSLLLSQELSNDQKHIAASTRKAAMQMDAVISQLFSKYFHRTPAVLHTDEAEANR